MTKDNWFDYDMDSAHIIAILNDFKINHDVSNDAVIEMLNDYL